MFLKEVKKYRSYFTNLKEQSKDESVCTVINRLCIVSRVICAPNFNYSQRVLTVRLRKILQKSHTKQLLKLKVPIT